MRIDVSRPLTDLAGKPIPGAPDAPHGVTLGGVAIEALLATLLDRAGTAEKLDGAAKVRHATLAQTIHQASGFVDLPIEDVALIKDRIGRAYAPIVVMRAWEILERDQRPRVLLPVDVG